MFHGLPKISLRYHGKKMQETPTTSVLEIVAGNTVPPSATTEEIAPKSCDQNEELFPLDKLPKTVRFFFSVTIKTIHQSLT